MPIMVRASGNAQFDTPSISAQASGAASGASHSPANSALVEAILAGDGERAAAQASVYTLGCRLRGESTGA